MCHMLKAAVFKEKYSWVVIWQCRVPISFENKITQLIMIGGGGLGGTRLWDYTPQTTLWPMTLMVFFLDTELIVF